MRGPKQDVKRARWTEKETTSHMFLDDICISKVYHDLWISCKMSRTKQWNMCVNRMKTRQLGCFVCVVKWIWDQMHSVQTRTNVIDHRTLDLFFFERFANRKIMKYIIYPAPAPKKRQTVLNFNLKRWMDVWCECFNNMVAHKIIALIFKGSRLLPWLPWFVRAIDAVCWLLTMARAANLHHV